MFRTLRTKLAIAFVALTFLSVAGVGVGALLLLRDREVKAATQRTGDLLPPEAANVGFMAQRGTPPDRIAGYLRERANALEAADRIHVRFVMLDADSNVVVDTDDKASGKFPGLSAGKSGRNVPNSYHITGLQEGPIRYIVYQQPSGVPALQQQRTFTPTTYDLLMLVPAASIDSAWTDLAPRLAVAGSLALIAALAVAFLIARGITRPLIRITHASEAMAQGQYEQQIPVEGRDEVARLARSFNDMATQVSGSHRMMRDLLANVAHELKTPLTSIQGFSQALSEGALQSPDEYAAAARIISEESDRMRRLVNDLLYLSQIESGELPLEPQVVDVEQLLQAAAERVQWELSDSGKSLRVVPTRTPAAVRVDPRRIDQVLANLVDNAIRYTPRGGTVTLSAVEAAQGRVHIAVHNTGSYIPLNELDRVFERFYQLDRSRQRSGRNGGLGLAIAREIVLAHGGEIWAESDAAAGTTFSVSLPIAERGAVIPAAPAPESAWAPPRAQVGASG